MPDDISGIYESMTPEQLAQIAVEYQRAYGGSGTFPSNYTYARDQFWKLSDIEPYPIDRRPVDNPKFLWPSNVLMDSAGDTKKIQRGYMRSLISDPAIDVTKQMKNRRLFFQFNPQVLVRSVQQTPGAMNPLLQDPAQLMAPVPGTTSFGFELMFNREHEVNAGYNDPLPEWLKLPNGQDALVAEIGVLADLMILDTITGQGLSEDMINALSNRAKRQYENINDENKKINDEREKAGLDKESLDYEPIEVPEEDDLKIIFESNLGNSAFLNPQPFRVMFSTLFMVEGVATSVEVVFQKFSKTMVPTQCKVTINMYALYLGFAKNKTFIFDNLRQSAQEQQKEIDSDFAVQQKLMVGMERFFAKLKSKGVDDDTATKSFPEVDNPYFKVRDIKRNEKLKKFLEDTEATEANFSFDLEWKFTPTNTTQISNEALKENGKLTLKQNGQKVNFNAKGTNNIGGLYAIADGSSDISIFQQESTAGTPIVNKYITYRIIMVLHVINTNGNVVEALFPGSVVYNAEWTKEDGANMDKESSFRMSDYASQGSRKVTP